MEPLGSSNKHQQEGMGFEKRGGIGGEIAVVALPAAQVVRRFTRLPEGRQLLRGVYPPHLGIIDTVPIEKAVFKQRAFKGHVFRRRGAEEGPPAVLRRQGAARAGAHPDRPQNQGHHRRRGSGRPSGPASPPVFPGREGRLQAPKPGRDRAGAPLSVPTGRDPPAFPAPAARAAALFCLLSSDRFPFRIRRHAAAFS